MKSSQRGLWHGTRGTVSFHTLKDNEYYVFMIVKQVAARKKVRKLCGGSRLLFTTSAHPLEKK
jgi:hypothetical protein